MLKILLKRLNPQDEHNLQKKNQDLEEDVMQ